MRSGGERFNESHLMWRWIRIAMILFSLLICVAASVFWVRSWFADDFWRHDGFLSRTYYVSSIDQRLVIVWADQPMVDPPEPGREWVYHESYHGAIRDQLAFLRDVDRQYVRFLGFEFYDADASAELIDILMPGLKSVQAVVIPYWIIVIPTALPPLWWLLRGRRSSKHYRRKHGLCLQCGYDIRGSTNACPECGRAANASTKVT